MDLHCSSVKDFILPKLKSVFVVDYYEGIKGALSSRKDFPYMDFLACPRVRTNTEIIWSTDAFTEQPSTLFDLQTPEKEIYSTALKARLDALQRLIDVLHTEEGGEPLSDLLSKAIAHVNEQSVYCSEGKVVLVNWGLIPRVPNYGYGCVYRSGKFVTEWLSRLPSSHTLNIPAMPSADIQVPPAPDISVTSPVGTPVTPVVEVPSIPIVDTPATPLVDMPKKSVDTANTPADTPSMPVNTPTTPLAGMTKTGIQVQNSAQEEKDGSNQGRDTNDGRNKCKWLWLLLLLPLLLILLYLFYIPGLPWVSRVLPVDSDKVVVSGDECRMIASNRINVLLECDEYDTMEKWAKAFNRLYRGRKYRIVYFNRDLGLLQLIVPQKEREMIMQKLPEQLSEFTFDVFEEGIQSSFESPCTDPDFSQQDCSWYFDAIQVYDAWNTTMGDSSVVVAVIDNGFDLSHPELKNKTVLSYNVITKSSRVRQIRTLCGMDGHGTHVASTAVGQANNDVGVSGIAPNCKLMAIQVGYDSPTGLMSTTAIMDGVVYAIKHKADVINLSLGSCFSSTTKQMTEGQQLTYIANNGLKEEKLWKHISRLAQKNNAVIVWAAGNDSLLSGMDATKRDMSAILVSAVDKKLQRTDFSNYGVFPNLGKVYSTLSAPGEDIYNAVPDNSFDYMSGTSMAAPIVSGAVALLKSMDKNLTVDQIISILQHSGRFVDNKTGPLIQLGLAARIVTHKDDDEDIRCKEIENQVRKLRHQLDSLLKICPPAGNSDTLKFKKVIKNPFALNGLWECTVELYSTIDGSPIKLYMSFENLDGELRLIMQDITYTAPLHAEIQDNRILIHQLENATSSQTNNYFKKYEYTCTSDKNDNLHCVAVSEDNSVQFYLIKI